MTGKEFFKKIFSPIIWVNLLGMLLLGILITLGVVFWMKSYTRHGQTVDVPDLKGVMLSNAEDKLEELELKAVVVDSIYNKTLPEGLIMEQTPAPGATVKADRNIYLTISTIYPPTMPVPNLINNCSYREAEARLKALGFKVGPVEYIEGDKDWVYGLKQHGRSIGLGDRINLEEPVTLVIGGAEMETDESGMDYNLMNDSVFDDGSMPASQTDMSNDGEELVF